MPTCKTCGKETDGYKCDICGSVSTAHDEQHVHGGDHCMPKCTACGEAEAKCTC